MRMRPLPLVLAMLLFPAAANANDHVADLLLAGSTAISSTLWGAHIALTKTLPWLKTVPDKGVPAKNLSFVGDFGVHKGSHDDVDVTQYTVMAGVRRTFSAAGDRGKFPFVHVLAGAIHATSEGAGHTDPAVAFGGGFEMWQQSVKRLGVRVEADYIVHKGENTTRISVGVLLGWTR